MNIALLHYSVPPVVGGVESVLAHHARLLYQAGHRVRLIAARGEPLNEAVPLVRVPLADSRHPRILAAKAELDAGHVPGDFALLVQELTDELRLAVDEVDVLIAHNVASLHKNLALTAALYALNGEANFPHLVLWHHDLAWTTPRYRNELHAGYPWDLLRSDWPGITHVVVSEPRRQELAALLDLPEERVIVVPNGVDRAPLLKLEPRTQALLGATGLWDAAPVLLLPVRLTPRKNIELALRVLRALRDWRAPADGSDQPFRRAALVVTGPEGPHNPANAAYRERLLALRGELGLDGAAHFAAEYTTEYLPDAVVADFYRLADALFLPSREEGFGIPLIEAALARLPVFCAEIPPLRDLGGMDVTYFPTDGDPGSIATQVAERLLADPAYRFAVRAREHFIWDRVFAEHLEPLLERAAQAPGSVIA